MGKLVHIVACLKKIWGLEMKKTRIDYYLINTSERVNKYFTKDWFREIIIKKNKDKVRLSANSILDKFLRETVALNIISLAKSRKTMIKKSGTTNYGNYHLAINNTVDISKLVQILIEDCVFEEQLNRNCELETSYLFVFRIANMANRILSQ